MITDFRDFCTWAYVIIDNLYQHWSLDKISFVYKVYLFAMG